MFKIIFRKGLRVRGNGPERLPFWSGVYLRLGGHGVAHTKGRYQEEGETNTSTVRRLDLQAAVLKTGWGDYSHKHMDARADQ